MSNYPTQSGSTQGADGKWYTPKQVDDFNRMKERDAERAQQKRWHYQAQIDAHMGSNDHQSLRNAQMKYNAWKR